MEFAGWLVGDSEEVQAEETEIDVTDDVTVKASWKEKVIPVDPDESVNPDDKDRDDPGKKDDSGKKDDQGKNDGKQEMRVIKHQQK